MFPEVRINTVHIDESDISLCNSIMVVRCCIMYMVRCPRARRAFVGKFCGCCHHARIVHVYVSMFVSPVEFRGDSICFRRGIRVWFGDVIR